MGESKPILRVGKIKRDGRSTPASVMGHLDRSRPTPNADPSRSKLNKWIVRPKNDLSSSIDDILSYASIDKSKIRKDAVISNDILLSVSPEWFRPDAPDEAGTWDENRLKIFQAEAEQLLRKTFGKRLIAATVHLDESTPHIHAVVVPILPKKDGGWRLSGKDMFNPGRLRALQQLWEDRMTPHGVGPRLKGSKARHTTLRQYYGVLEETRKVDKLSSFSIADPPSGFSSKAKKEQWKKKEEKRVRDELRPLAVQAAKGRLYDAERRAYNAVRSELDNKTKLLFDAYEEIELSKEQIGKLRKLPINDVAVELDYYGEIKKKENAIDLTMRVGELNYQQAIVWLAQRFGKDAAAVEVKDDVLRSLKNVDSKKILSKADKIKKKCIEDQCNALGANNYRITVMREADGKKVAQNLGKSDDGEKFYSKDDIVDLIPKLSSLNAKDGNIFITPIDNASHFVLVDDLSKDGLSALKKRNYSPSVVLETSPNNFQAILKLPKTHASKDDANEFFKDINRDIGDEKITGLVHPMRLAGFHNRKSKHATADGGKPPFVRLVLAVNRFCETALSVVRSYSQSLPQANAHEGRSPSPGGRSTNEHTA